MARFMESSKVWALANSLGSTFAKVALIFSFVLLLITATSSIEVYCESLISCNEFIFSLYSATLASILDTLDSNSSFSTWVFVSMLLVLDRSPSRATYFFLDTQDAKTAIPNKPTKVTFFIFLIVKIYKCVL